MRSRSLLKKVNGRGTRAALRGCNTFSIARRLVERTSIAVLARRLGATLCCVRDNMCVS